MKSNKPYLDQERTPLLAAMKEYVGTHPAFFRIPGHRGVRGIDERLREMLGDAVFDFDLTEAEGLDDLHEPRGAILEAERLYAELYGAKKSFLLVNGTTCGNEAMVLSTVKTGDTLIVPRNAHKSVLMGLILSGAKPTYVMPEVIEDFGIAGGISPASVQRVFDDAMRTGNTDDIPKAVLSLHPTYYGITSDIKTISDICHKNQAALLVDEAHGSHFYFSDELPKGAIAAGADMCAMSIHKTSGSFTQSSVLHIGSDRIDAEAVKKALTLVMSTSPSYLLMASLDAARHEMWKNGKRQVQRAISMAEEIKEKLLRIEGMSVLRTEEQDKSRLVFSAARLGISGYKLQKSLYEDFYVSTELSDARNVVCVITGANTKEDIERLHQGVLHIAANRDKYADYSVNMKGDFAMQIPKIAMTPREAYFAKQRTVDFDEIIGKAAGEMVVPYPPGIPILCPGEVITKEIYERISDYVSCGVSFHGVADESFQTFRIIDN